MAVGITSGNPQYGPGGISNYIPTIFAGRTLEKLYNATCLSEIANTDYLGEVTKMGDKVIVRTIPDITINNYVKGQKLSMELPESASVEFTLDYAKYFYFGLDDVDRKQMDKNRMTEWADDAAMQLKLAIETHVFGTIYADANSKNAGDAAGAISGGINLGKPTAPLALTKTNIIDVIVDMGTVLDEQNIPETDRWMILPAWATAMIKKSDLKDAAMTGDPVSPLRNGKIGRIDRFTIYNSNLLATTTDGSTVYYPLFGHKMALAFVTQLTKTELVRPTDGFLDAMKGLNVYGFEVVQPKALGYGYVYKG